MHNYLLITGAQNQGMNTKYYQIKCSNTQTNNSFKLKHISLKDMSTNA